MSGTVQVTPDPAQSAGCAVIRVAGAAAAVATPGFRVQRDPDWTDATLGRDGWQSSDAVLAPDRAAADGPDLVLHVGWAVCRFLEGGVYEVSVPGAGVPPTGVFWPDITPPAPVVVAPTPKAAAPPTAPPASPPSPIQQAVPPPQPVPAAPPATVAPVGKTSRSFVVPGILLLVVLGVGGYFAYRHFGQRPIVTTDAAPPVAEVPVPSPPAEPPVTPPTVPAPAEAPVPPAVPPPTLEGLSVPDVLTRAPNTAAITVEGERRLRGTQRDDGLLLLEAAADRGDAAAAAAIARLYDPVLFQPGGAIPRADARQAARLYRDAARGSADVAIPREALRRRLQEQAGRGDLGADLMLKDFWP